MSDDITRLQPHTKDPLSTTAKHSAELKLKLEKVATAKRMGLRYCFSTCKSSTRKQSLHTHIHTTGMKITHQLWLTVTILESGHFPFRLDSDSTPSYHYLKVKLHCVSKKHPRHLGENIQFPCFQFRKVVQKHQLGEVGNDSTYWVLASSVIFLPYIMKIRQCFGEFMAKTLGMFFETQGR